jgi:uncharacterized membrane protein
MAIKSVSLQVIGIVLIVIGTGLALWGYQQSGSITSGITKALTGSNTNEVMAFYIFGALDIIVGLFLYFKK